jgi:hypothetical protein
MDIFDRIVHTAGSIILISIAALIAVACGRLIIILIAGSNIS